MNHDKIVANLKRKKPGNLQFIFAAFNYTCRCAICEEHWGLSAVQEPGTGDFLACCESCWEKAKETV